MASSSSSVASSRFHELQASLPPVTIAVIATCCGVYVSQLLFHLDLSRYTLCPRLVVFLHEYYRCITSTLFHANLMHLGMNMMSTSAISAPLERKVGTLRHAFSILWAILMTSVINILMAFVWYLFVGGESLLFQHGVGFSGVLFHLCVLESNMSSGSRSVFGVFSVPSYLYPWVLLLVLQVMMPNISFEGHLAGIITGTLELYGVWNSLLIPTDPFLSDMEQWRILRPLSQYPTFAATPTFTGVGNTSHSYRDATALRHALGQGICFVWKWISYVIEFLQYCLLGRGRVANANLYLPRTMATNATLASSRSILIPAANRPTTTSTTPTAWSLDTDYLDDADEENHTNEQRSLLQPQQQPQQQSSLSSSLAPPATSKPPTISKLV